LDARQEQLKQLLLECGEEAISRPDDWLAYQLVPDYFGTYFWCGQ
jgi:hypothetical protein